MRCDENMKLTRLIQYFSGSARDALEGCMLIGRETGYDKASKILEERFGYPDMITEGIVINLRCGKPVKSAPELLRLSDELSNASMILTDLNMTHEVVPQSVIVEILEWTPFYVQQNGKNELWVLRKLREHIPNFTICVICDRYCNKSHWSRRWATLPEARQICA